MTETRKKGTTIFERAAKAVPGGSAKECGALIADLEALIRLEEAERDRIAPPGQAQRYRPDGIAVMAPTPPGPDYRDAIRAEDMERVEALERRHRVLVARLQEAGNLLAALRDRQKAATAEEKLAEAPKRLKALRKDLPGMMERAEGAVQEATAALAALGEWLRDVHAARALLDDDSAFLEPADLARLGTILRHRLLEETEWEFDNPTRRAPALFGSRSQALAAVALLGRPDSGWIDRLRRLLGAPDDAPPHRKAHAERQAVQRITAVRLSALAAGDLAVVNDAKVLAERAAADDRTPGGKRRATLVG